MAFRTALTALALLLAVAGLAPLASGWSVAPARSQAQARLLARAAPARARSGRPAIAMMAQLRRNDRGRTDRPKRDPRPQMNEQITADPLRVVLANAAEGDEQLGVLSRDEALAKADEVGMDLVMISAKAEPPVVKIVDYGKFKYAEEKKKKEQAKKSKQNEMKELKMRYAIDTHDYGVRLKSAIKFLEGGHRVRLVVQFRGRENQFHHIGKELLERFGEDTAEVGTAEGRPKKEGNRLTMLLSPKK